MHFEYDLGGAEKGAPKLTKPAADVMESMKRDLAIVRNWLRKN